MKKLFVLLLAFALAGAAFAQAPAPTVSGSATLSWGVDLDGKTSGFSNASASTIKFTILPKASAEKKGEGVYGYILLKDYTLGVSNGAFAWTAPTITAKVVLNQFYFTVFGAPSLTIDKVASTHGVAGTLAGYTAGTTVGYDGDVDFAVKVLSKGDWTANTGNDYALGADFSGSLNDMIAYKASVATDLSTVYAGVSLPITLAVMKGLTVTPAADLAIMPTFDYEAGVDAELQLSDANADDVYTALTGSVYFCTNKDLEVAVAFDEPLSGGIVENAEFGASFSALDVLTAGFGWDFATYAGYSYDLDKTNTLYGRADFATDETKANDLSMSASLTNTAIANTTLSVTYTSGNFLARDRKSVV